MPVKNKDGNISSVLEVIEDLSDSVETLLDPDDGLKSNLSSQVKHLYDFMKHYDSIVSTKSNPLHELLLTGFDNEQIWQELQLQNNLLLPLSKKSIQGLIGLKHNLSLYPHLKEKTSKKAKVRFEDSDEEDIDFVVQSANEVPDHEHVESDSEKEESTQTTYRKTVVDDPFFKLGQMEEYLDMEDRREEMLRNGDVLQGSAADDDDEDIDYFMPMDEDENFPVEDVKYKDFFDPVQEEKKTGKMVEGDEPDEPDDLSDGSIQGDEANEDISADEGAVGNDMEEEMGEEPDSQDKSGFEENQEKMLKTIQRLEKANLSAKPWQLSGETTAKQRPINSLLEEHVTFEHTSVGAPVITEQTTETLEDLIKQRIKDEAWDDVERQVKPSTQPYEYKKAPELNQEKSKLSLAEVYEKEYLQQMEGDEEEEKEKEEHAAIRIQMEKLFAKLDALSNYHYTPKPPKPEIKVVTNEPVIQMEEVTPIMSTDASQLAPEEIHDKKREVVGASEMTKEDKKRARRKKKIKKKFAAQDREKKSKLAQKSGKVLKSSDKKKAVDKLKKSWRNTIVSDRSANSKAVKSSSDFFNRLQHEVKTGISSRNTAESSAKKDKRRKSGKVLKL